VQPEFVEFGIDSLAEIGIDSERGVLLGAPPLWDSGF
jgi:hypothetical protein